MKIQCACGAKYAFDLTAEQAQHPVQFVCPACGLDSSTLVTELARQEFGIAPAAVAPPAEIAPPPVPALTDPLAPIGSVASPTESASPPMESPLPQPPPVPRARLHSGGQKAVDAPAVVTDVRLCPKHPGVRTVDRCVVCGKAICPKCMELFGYVCSPRCREKGELQGIEIPIYENQKALVEKRRGRKAAWIVAGACGFAAALLGAWIWYAWFATVPHVTWSVRFTEPAYSGESRLCGQDQIVFLHGGTLARYDLKLKKQIWSVELIDQKQIDRQVQEEIKRVTQFNKKLANENPDADAVKLPGADKLARQAAKAAAAALDLRVVGQSIWVLSPGKLTRYDWDSGKVAKEITVANRLISRGDELLMLDDQPGERIITHINLASGELRKEEFPEPEKFATEVATKSSTARSPSPTAAAGLPTGSGKDIGKPMDPAKVQEQASHLGLAGRIALPATLSINRNQERALAEMQNGSGQAKAPARSEPAERFTLIPAKDGAVEFSSRLIEERFVTRDAMKAPPKKSALSSNVTVTQTADVANEILNEMQRDRGGSTATEDESRYQVTIRRPDPKDPAEWTGEVIGPPELFPLKTVNVLTSNKKLTVFDKRNKKVWDATLSFNVRGGGGSAADESTGLGPCVERGDTLFIFDQGVLTAFDLKTGSASWRVPSVGITALFFDSEGQLYVNTTTANPESIKYSRQIDVASTTSGVILKIDPASGKILWSKETKGLINYVSGKFIYSIQSYHPDDEDDENPYKPETGFETPPYLRIRRINPKNGEVMWEHFQQRAPLDVRFDKNTIRLVFKKEVQLLKFLSL